MDVHLTGEGEREKEMKNRERHRMRSSLTSVNHFVLFEIGPLGELLRT